MPMILTAPSRAAAGLTLAGLFIAAPPGFAVDNLLVNRGFEDTTEPADGTFGDGWGAFGAAGFNNFFGSPTNPNGHASLFGDRNTNTGGVFQLGIAGTPGATYQFDLLDTRIESAWDADLRFGLEYYLADDTTKIGETLVTIDAATRLALPNVGTDGAANGAVFSMQGTAVPGTAIVRPVVLFDNVNPSYPGDTGPGQPQANAFVFGSFLSEVPAPGGNVLKNPGFEDIDGDGNLGNVWGTFGNTGFNDFFGGNGHASLFADTFDNSGGLFQQSILGTPGAEYTFELSDVRIEENFDADLAFGVEFFGGDDFNKLGETLTVADTSVSGDGLSFSVTGTAPAGTEFVRPIVSFDNVNGTYLEQDQANLFIFETALFEAVSEILGDYNDNGLVEQGDLNQVLNNWGVDFSAVAATWINQRPTEGIVDQAELNVVLNRWGSDAAPDFTGSAVPEPASLALLALTGLLLSQRRG